MNPIQKTITYLTILTSFLVGFPNNSLAINIEKEAYKTFKEILGVSSNNQHPYRHLTTNKYLERFADKISHNPDNIATVEEMINAARKLKDISGKVADKEFGDKDGIPEQNEIERMHSYLRKNNPKFLELLLFTQ